MRIRRTLTHKILDIIEAGQEEGVIRKEVSVYTIRHLILGMLEHIVIRWPLKGQEDDIPAFAGMTEKGAYRFLTSLARIPCEFARARAKEC